MKKTLLIGLLILGIIGGGWWATSRKVAKVSQVEQVEPIRQTQGELTQLTVDFGDGNVATVASEQVVGLTAYELLEQVAKEKGWKIDSTKYDFGVFVKGINGVEGSEEKSWIYFVNGEAGNVAADKQGIETGDRVEWKFIKSQ